MVCTPEVQYFGDLFPGQLIADSAHVDQRLVKSGAGGNTKLRSFSHSVEAQGRGPLVKHGLLDNPK